MAISGTKGQGWRAISTQYRKSSDILTSTLAEFLFSSSRVHRPVVQQRWVSRVPRYGDNPYFLHG